MNPNPSPPPPTPNLWVARDPAYAGGYGHLWETTVPIKVYDAAKDIFGAFDGPFFEIGIPHELRGNERLNNLFDPFFNGWTPSK